MVDIVESVSNPLVIVPIVGGLIGIGVGMVSIWSMVKNMKRNQKLDMDISNQESEKRLKEFFNLKMVILENKIEQHYVYFKEWIQRVEKDVDDRK